MNNSGQLAFVRIHKEKSMSQQERVLLVRTIAEELKDILLPHGFVKCRSTYMRRHGDALLQYVTVISDKALCPPHVCVGIVPLYRTPAGFWRRWLPGLRSISGIGGYRIERVAGIEALSYDELTFLYRSDYHAAISFFKDMLCTKILPILEEVRSAEDVLDFMKFNPVLDPVYPQISLLLRVKEYAIVGKCLAEKVAISQKQLIQAYSLFDNGIINKAALEYHRRLDEECRSFCNHLLLAVSQYNEDQIDAELENALHAAYDELSKYSKKFVQLYPNS